MTDEKKITKGLDKELMQLIDAEMNDPVLGKLLNRNAAYVLGKEIKLVLIERACEWLEDNLYELIRDQEFIGTMCKKYMDKKVNIEQFRKAMKGE